jgi:hypothetical protein
MHMHHCLTLEFVSPFIFGVAYTHQRGNALPHSTPSFSLLNTPNVTFSPMMPYGVDQDRVHERMGCAVRLAFLPIHSQWSTSFQGTPVSRPPVLQVSPSLPCVRLPLRAPHPSSYPFPFPIACVRIFPSSPPSCLNRGRWDVRATRCAVHGHRPAETGQSLLAPATKLL